LYCGQFHNFKEEVRKIGLLRARSNFVALDSNTDYASSEPLKTLVMLFAQ